MPELPEVETVRAGLAPHVLGRRITSASVLHPRVSRNQLGGSEEFIARVTGRQIAAVDRRGKFLWLLLDDEQTLLAHLGMSGQLRVGNSPETHRRATLTLDDSTELHFIDQRTFGYLRVCEGESDPDKSGRRFPVVIKHIAPDLLEVAAAGKVPTLAQTLRSKRPEVKRVLLNQNVVSGIGNIYADEMLWLARIHPRRTADSLTQVEAERLLGAGVEIMEASLAAGGTSFDALYVNVAGERGYFDRKLHAYGQKICSRCGAQILPEKFMNRKSYFCVTCQPM